MPLLFSLRIPDYSTILLKALSEANFALQGAEGMTEMTHISPDVRFRYSGRNKAMAILGASLMHVPLMALGGVFAILFLVIQGDAPRLVYIFLATMIWLEFAVLLWPITLIIALLLGLPALKYAETKGKYAYKNAITFGAIAGLVPCAIMGIILYFGGGVSFELQVVAAIAGGCLFFIVWGAATGALARFCAGVPDEAVEASTA